MRLLLNHRVTLSGLRPKASFVNVDTKAYRTLSDNRWILVFQRGGPSRLTRVLLSALACVDESTVMG